VTERERIGDMEDTDTDTDTDTSTAADTAGTHTGRERNSTLAYASMSDRGIKEERGSWGWESEWETG